ncbi:MAG TPA: GvpL/GvpF family gas vesicle protein [Terriglobales bacterium]|nr:GvpL/GvpF family gas vesicle protein [Terriglobales bacterium]
MPILLYCLSQPATLPDDTIAGVAGSPVLCAELSDLCVFTSSSEDSSLWLKRELRQSGIEFHRVLAAVFSSDAIIPFRFPTIFASHDELARHIAEHSLEYKASLERFAGLVQMEIRIGRRAEVTTVKSGAAYLKGKQTAINATEQFSDDLKRALSSTSLEWRQRTTRDGIRQFLLVERSRIPEFEAAARNVPVPDGMSVRVSGPWPVSEFLEQSRR